MDTRETYIKMCDCEEMQKSFPAYDDSNYIYNLCRMKVVYSSSNVYWDGGNGLIWLPTQDQLQGMVISGHPDGAYQLVMLLGDFRAWFLERATLKQKFTSMEQLWLAFVMKEKYNKIWNGEKWEINV